MRLNYNGKTLGTITTNHSMSIEECIESLEIDTEVYSEIELFSTDFFDEYSGETISKIYVGQSWRNLDSAGKEYFLHLARATEKEGDCIVDFEGLSISIPGEIIITKDESVIEIDNTSVFYNPTM